MAKGVSEVWQPVPLLDGKEPAMSETPARALTWEYLEHLEALNHRLAAQIVGYSDRVQESLRGVRADTYRDAANHLTEHPDVEATVWTCVDLLRAHAIDIEREGS